MGRYLEAKCKLCRRERMKLFLKGPKCNTEKCPMTKRPFPPGMHGRLQSGKPSYYALQLREKQKVKRVYGMLERQFRRFFDIAVRSKGVTGKVLLQLLERRLDNVVYRVLFALSRSQARQFVRHGFIFVNGKRVDIPSYLVSQEDVIEIRAKDSVKKLIKENIEMSSKERSIPEWLNVDKNNLRVELKRLPERGDITLPVNEQLIVELYSK